MNKNSKLWIFLKGLIAENPVLVLVLGTCPTLAQTGSVIAALSMGACAIKRSYIRASQAHSRFRKNTLLYSNYSRIRFDCSNGNAGLFTRPLQYDGCLSCSYRC